MKRLRVLGLSASMGHVAYVYLDGENLLDWEISREAAQSTSKADKYVRKLIKKLKPDFIVTEDVTCVVHKGDAMKAIIETITRTANHSVPLNVTIERPKHFKNKYEEAQQLTQKHTDLKPWLPAGRRCWEAEPRTMVAFEALALVEAVKRPQS